MNTMYNTLCACICTKWTWPSFRPWPWRISPLAACYVWSRRLSSLRSHRPRRRRVAQTPWERHRHNRPTQPSLHLKVPRTMPTALTSVTEMAPNEVSSKVCWDVCDRCGQFLAKPPKRSLNSKVSEWNYRQTSHISRTLVGNMSIHNSDIVGASPGGAAPTASSLSI